MVDKPIVTQAAGPSVDEVRELVAFVDKTAWWLDDCMSIPGTRFRFGLDAIVGLIPVGGDVLAVTGTAAFGTKQVGSGKAVNVTGMALSGLDAGNYTLASTTASTTASISARTAGSA